jgi:hypothetical protein
MNNEPLNTNRPSCFIVMPFGKNTEEQKWFKGWYQVVISPAVLASGYEPVLSADEEQPGAINDEIRAHLAFDPMVLVDLGGFKKTDEPNPNVMYELGIRHALGLPLIIMGWDGQKLPFDVSNQRVIMHDRDFLDIDQNKKKIIAFIQAATEGKYYKPMDSVARMATIAAASESISEDSILSALVQEVKELKGSLQAAVNLPRTAIKFESTLLIKTLLSKKALRQRLFVYFDAAGGDSTLWNAIIKKRVSVEFSQLASVWSLTDWMKYIDTEFDLASPGVRKFVPLEKQAPVLLVSPLSEKTIELVKAALPQQPWPKDTHKVVVSELGITNSQYKRAVDILIDRGYFKQQVNGVLLPKLDQQA